MEHKEFADLKAELKEGNNERLKLIFESNSSYCINKLLFKHRCSSEDAKDIFVDSILNFRKKLIEGKIDVLVDLRAYLYATCKNMLLVRIKTEQRVSTAALEHFNGYSNDWGDQDQLAYKEEILKLAQEALSSLPDKCQQLLKAFYFDKLSMEEIAHNMEFASANVAKVSKSRCFQKLLEQVKIIQKEKLKENAIK